MGVFQRIVDRAAVNDDYENFDDEFDGDIIDDEADEAMGEITEIHALPAQDEPAELARIVTLWPRIFDDVKEFADHFRSGVPVILNLSTAEEAVRNRIVDFALGVCYGLGGQLNKISNDVLLLTPRTVTMESPRASHDRF